MKSNINIHKTTRAGQPQPGMLLLAPGHANLLRLKKFIVRVLVVCTAFILLQTHAAKAQNDLANPSANIQTIPAGSFVIPMDSLNYYGTFTKLFNVNTYGLLLTLLNNKIGIHWFITAGKAKDGIDFSANMTKILPTSATASTKNLRAGPMVIYPRDTTGVRALINTFNAKVASSSTGITKTKVNIYRTTAAVSADLRYILTQKPSVGILNDGGNASIEIQYFLDANAPTSNYVTLSGHNLLSGCYTIATQPHNDTVKAANLDSIQSFLNQGGNFFAQCKGIDTYEDFVPSGGTPGYFQTTEGITVNNKNVSLSYPNPDVAFNQFLGGFNATTIGGVSQTWFLTPAAGSTPASAYKNNGYTTVDNGTPTTGSSTNKHDHISGSVAKIKASTAAGSMMFYLGGHDYSSGAGSGTDFTNGERIYFNAVLTPCGTRTSCNGLFFDIDMGVTQTASATSCINDTITLTVSVKDKGPSIDTATGVVVTDTIPSGLSYVSYSATKGTYNSSTGKWTLPAMTYGDSETLLIKVLAQTTSSKTLSAVVTATAYDQNSTNDTVKVTVSAYPLPTATTIASTSICSGNSISIGATAVAGHTYSWVSSPAGFTSTSSNPSVSPTTTTTYTLKETNTSTGCTKSNTVTITVNPLPAASVIANTAICTGSSISIGATAVAGHTYSWVSSPVGFTSTAANPSVSPAVATTYTLTETITSTGCVKSNSVIISVNPLPTAAVAINSSICMGGSIAIGASAVAGDTYSWSSTPSGFSSISANPTVSPIANTTYSLTETITATGCSKTNPVNITVNPLPLAFTVSNSSICIGSSISIGTASIAGHTYAWTSTPAGLASASSNPSVGPVVATTYKLTETITATGCSKTDSVTISINALPVAAVASDTSICAGKTVSLGKPAVSGNTYSWSSSPAGFSSSSSNPSATPTTNTTYTMTETTANGCMKSNSITITIKAAPSPSISGDSSVCANSNSDVYTTASSSFDSYVWGIAGGSITSGQGTHTLNVDWSSSGTGTISLIETNGVTGCSASVSYIVNINAKPGSKLIKH